MIEDKSLMYCFDCIYLYIDLHMLYLQEHRGLLSVRYPMEHGIVKDWNDMERIWQYVYSKEQLQTFSEEVKPCAFTHYFDTKLLRDVNVLCLTFFLASCTTD